MGSSKTEYQLIFFATKGIGPHICRICDKEVLNPWEDNSTFYNRKGKLFIHHKDGDRENNNIENLEALHGTCHTSEHAQKQVRTEESNEKRRRTMQKFWSSAPEEKRKRMLSNINGSKFGEGQVYKRKSCGKAHPFCRVCRPDLLKGEQK